MDYKISVENIKCGGCANSIRGKLMDLGLATEVEVDIDSGEVAIHGDAGRRATAVAALLALGYPETGSVEGLKAAAAKAKSFVSCAVGRIDNSPLDKG